MSVMTGIMRPSSSCMAGLRTRRDDAVGEIVGRIHGGGEAVGEGDVFDPGAGWGPEGGEAQRKCCGKRLSQV